MPKFKVCVQRYVEETAIVEIEADTPVQAMLDGHDLLRAGDIKNWGPGDDMSGDEVYAVLNQAGATVWER